MRWIFALMLMLCGTAVAEPALHVGQVDGKPLVKAVAGRLAAWRPAADALVVVIPAESGDTVVGDIPKGLKAQTFTQNGMTGVVLTGMTGSWQVVQDGANWLVRPGAGRKSESVLMLKDGWRVAGKTLVPQTLNVAGKNWDVAMVDSDVSVAGSVAGAVRVAGTGPAVEVASIPVETEKTPAKLDVVTALPTLKAVAEPAITEAAVGEEIRPEAGAAKLSAVKGNAYTVRGNLAEIEPAAGEPEEAAGRASPLAAPVVLKKEVGLVTESTATSGLSKVALHPGPAMKPISMSTAADEVLPQVLGEIYLPGTVVSLTLPDDHVHGGLTKVPEVAEVISETVQMAVQAAKVSETLQQAQVSKTWNQTTLAPIEAALKATPSEVASQSEAVAVASEDVADEEPEVAVSRLFPNKEAHYFDQITDALQAVVVAPEGSTRAKDAELILAQTYLIWQRPEEALAVLGELPKRADGTPANPQARLYMAVAHIGHGDSLTDKEWDALLDQGGPLAGHGKLWKAVAASKDGDYATALKTWPQERGILPQYPAYLREMAQFAQASALVQVGDRAVAKKVVDELVAAYKDPKEVPVGLMRLQGLVRLGTPDESEGLKYLAAAAEDLRDPEQAYRAKFQFVQALRQRHDLSDAQVLAYLSVLWFDWRGDDLERDVLNSLADLYDKDDQPREALLHWQVLVKAFPKSTDLSGVTQRMTDAFLRVFDPENPKIYDLLAYVGLYYDFSELVPNDERGDVVHEQVARMLMNANLWDRAVPILEQQLQYRPLDPAAQGRLALMLAEAYGNLGRAAEGLKLLDKWEKVANTTVLARSWKIEDAKLLMLLDRPQAAEKTLATLPKDDLEARDLRIEATWAAKDWSSTIPLLQDKLANVPASQLVSDTGAQLATFRLGYAYGQLKDAKNLDALSQRYSASLGKLPQLADDIGAVAAGTGVSASVVASGPLAPLTTALNDINRLTDRVQQVRDAVTEQRHEQKEYNDKMRYMDLLPPPAL